MAGGRGGLISLDRHLKLTNVLRQIFGFGAVDFECVLISCHGKWMDDLFIHFTAKLSTLVSVLVLFHVHSQCQFNQM